MAKLVASIKAASITAGWQGPYNEVLSRNALKRTWSFVSNGMDQQVDTIQWYPTDSQFEAAAPSGNTTDYFSCGALPAKGLIVETSDNATAGAGLLGASCDSFGIHTSAATAPTVGTLDIYVEEFFE